MGLFWLLLCFTLIGASPGSAASASEPELSIVPRIINGTDTTPGSSPWHVILMTATSVQLCWGSLVNENWVITAAHCNITTSDLVVVGMYDRPSGRNDIQILKIAQVFIYPHVYWSVVDNDVALLKLESPARFSTTVSPASLPTASDRFRPGRQCFTLGFAPRHPNASNQAKILQQAMMSLLTNTECRKHWGRIITDAKICARGKSVSCLEVDSGGPLVCRKKKVWSLVGVISFMSETCPTQRPLVFTRVTKIVPWIQETMANN
ncbi:chymotrypsinogen B-like [Talpa occidentalis]|uniref:chymotrypsinogen B-like n=1 Tax=Talpa occidentalis TaxID=50954 RepID=UPI0023F7E534|nr:chymotrypsinogen B-like [Talpa occidentalis]